MPEPGERRPADRPVTYKPSRVPGGVPVRYGWSQQNQATAMDKLRAAAAARANVPDQARLIQQQREEEYNRKMAALEQSAQAALYKNDPSYRSAAAQRAQLEAQWAAQAQQQYNGAGSAGNLYAQQAQAAAAYKPPTYYSGPGSSGNLYAQQAAAAFAPPNYYSGPGSSGNLYAAAARENQAASSKYKNVRNQQAAYHSTLSQNTMNANDYYFGPGSMEQYYATTAYANAPIGIPTVPVDNSGYGYGGGYGSGGGYSYAAAEPDIPRWLYGMLSWRYR